MSMTIPETANRKDWPRLVAQKAKDTDKRLAAIPSRAKLRFVA